MSERKPAGLAIRYGEQSALVPMERVIEDFAHVRAYQEEYKGNEYNESLEYYQRYDDYDIVIETVCDYKLADYVREFLGVDVPTEMSAETRFLENVEAEWSYPGGAS